jgi:hypothetical protein
MDIAYFYNSRVEEPILGSLSFNKVSIAYIETCPKKV